MQERLVNSIDRVQKSACFSGSLACEHEIHTTTLQFASKVIWAKFIAKHHTLDCQFSQVKKVNVQDNMVTIQMAFKR